MLLGCVVLLIISCFVFDHYVQFRKSDKELNAAVALLDKSNNRRQALEDVTWALLNAKEFVLRK